MDVANSNGPTILEHCKHFRQQLFITLMCILITSDQRDYTLRLYPNTNKSKQTEPGKECETAVTTTAGLSYQIVYFFPYCVQTQQQAAESFAV